MYSPMYQPSWEVIAKASPEAQKMAYEGFAEINRRYVEELVKSIRERRRMYPVSSQVKQVSEILRDTYGPKRAKGELCNQDR